jgi:hypothetical protein
MSAPPPTPSPAMMMGGGPPIAPDTRPARSLRLTKFDMSRIADDSTVLFIGKRNTGKSYLIKDLL